MFDDESHVKEGKEMYLYTYSTEHLSKKDKVRFYYALKGREGKTGIVKSFKIEHLGRTVLMVPKQFKEDMDNFIQVWNLSFTARKVIVDSDVRRGGSK